MKLSFLKPKEKQKVYPLRLEDIREAEEEEWNSFSSTPQTGEKWASFPPSEEDPDFRFK